MAALACGSCLIWFNAKAIQAEHHFTQAHLWTQSNSLQAFFAAYEAYKAFPYDVRNRLQISLSLETVVHQKFENVRVDNTAADKAHQIALSASPKHPAILVSRARYLLNSGRWSESDEIKDIVQSLERSARIYPQSWIVIAYYSALTGNRGKAAEAIMNGLKTGGDFEEMKKVANAINMEITEQ